MMVPLSTKRLGRLTLVLALAGCGSDNAPPTKEIIDVTPANATNIVQHTGVKVEEAIQQNTLDLDAAIEAQSGGKPAQ